MAAKIERGAPAREEFGADTHAPRAAAGVHGDIGRGHAADVDDRQAERPPADHAAEARGLEPAAGARRSTVTRSQNSIGPSCTLAMRASHAFSSPPIPCTRMVPSAGAYTSAFTESAVSASTTLSWAPVSAMKGMGLE